MILEYFYLSIYYIFYFILKLIPNGLLKAFSSFLGLIIFYLNKKHRNIILKNLEHFSKLAKSPQSVKIAKQVYKNFTFYIFSMVKNQKISEEKLLSQIKIFKNEEFLQNLIKNKQKIIITTAHFGYWEILPAVINLHFGSSMSIVGRALEAKKIDEILRKNREKFRVKLIEKNNALRPMIKAIANGDIVGLVNDQDAHIKESCEFLLYDKKVTQNKGASILAKRSDAWILPAYIYQVNGGFAVEFFAPMNAREKSIEELSFYQLECTKKMWEQHPSEYFWFHKRFKTFYEDEY